MATSTQVDEGGGFLSRLGRAAVTASGRVAETEFGRTLSPVVDQGIKATSAGLQVAGQLAEQAREITTQKRLWEEQHALIEQVLEVLTLQQAVVEDLRGRVAALEADR